MSHHGREYEDRNECGIFCSVTYDKLQDAVKLITDIAKSQKADPSCACDTWLAKYGYPCETTERKAREARKAKLDADIARLQKERDSL